MSQLADAHPSQLRAQQSLLAKKIVRPEAVARARPSQADPLPRAQTDKAFCVTPCSYDDVLSLDADLIAFEKSLPPAYELPVDGANRVQFAVPPTSTEMRAALIQLYLAAEFVRLHRPFLGETSLVSPARAGVHGGKG